jgi:hypothetical protein
MDPLFALLCAALERGVNRNIIIDYSNSRAQLRTGISGRRALRDDPVYHVVPGLEPIQREVS